MAISASRLDSFQKFEQLRQMAQKQVASNPQNRLARLIEAKRESMAGALNHETTNSPRAVFKKPSLEKSGTVAGGLSGVVHQGLKKANELLMYDGNIGTTSFTEGSRKLGNYIDLVG